MKKIFYIILLLVFACNSEDANDCFQKAGNTIQKEVPVTAFETILVNRDVELILKQGPEFLVSIESGENLMNDITAEVIGEQLQITDNNTCNFVRDYALTKVYVQAPNVSEIRSSTQYDISSDGVLEYDQLTLISEDFNAPGTFTTGDFRLQVANMQQLRVTTNNMSFIYVSGSVENLSVRFFSGAGRFEGANLIAQNVDVYHRGSNDMIVNPQQQLTGELRGPGDLISVSQPTVVDVEQFYTGALIFD